MRAKGIVVVVSFAVIGALMVSVGGATAAPKAKPKTVKCTAKPTDQTPGTGHPTLLGLETCGKPLGNGVFYEKLKLMPTSQTAGTLTGKLKWFFDRGTVHGTVNVAFMFTGQTSATFKGKVTFTGGTGAFKHVAGSGKVSCATADGVHLSCDATAKLTGI